MQRISQVVYLLQATCLMVKKKKNAKNFASGLFIPGDLPDGEKNTKIF
jgi:anaerobic glycerol-3-phosphate dehydrogenase